MTQANVILRHLRSVVAAEQDAELSDRQLLERFAARREQGAFEALVRRHAPLVFGVCRRVLRQEQDAEDAFQATFLVLARKAGDVGRHGSVAGWLHRVAYRAALRARAQSARRERYERQAPPRQSPDMLEEVTGREFLAVLDEELQRLPEDRRVPLILCYLQGHTCDDAARQLGWSLRTLKRRLEQGRHSLRARLARRGIALPAALLTLGLTQKGKAAVPAAWVAATIRAALELGAGPAQATAAGAVAEAVLRGMCTARLKAILALLLVGSLILGAGALARQGQAPRPEAPPAAPPVPVAELPEPSAPPAPPPARDEGDAKKTAVRGRVLGAYDRPVRDARVLVYGTVSFGSLRRQYQDKALGEVKTDADGAFRLAVPALAAGHYTRLEVLVIAKGYGPAWHSGAADEPPPVTLQLPRERTAVGRLIDLQGQPAAGLKLRPIRVLPSAGRGRAGGSRRGASPSGADEERLNQAARRHQGFEFREGASGWPAAVTTDAEGRFHLDGFGRDQEVHLLVEDDRFARQEVVVPAEGEEKNKELSVTLLPPRLFTGRAVTADTDKPVAGARVRVTTFQRTESPTSAGPFAEGRTGADGRFSVNAFSGEQFLVEVLPPSGEPYLAAFKPVAWPRGAVKREVDFTLTRGVLVRGTVVEPGGKKPVVAATVSVMVPGETTPRLPLAVLDRLNHKAFSGADGSFEVVAPTGPSHLVVTGPNPDYVYRTITEEELTTGKPGGEVRHFHAVLPLDLRAKDGPKEVKVELRRAVTVKGRIVGPDGKPVPSAELAVPSELDPPPDWRYLQRSLLETTRVSTLMATGGTFELANCDPEKTYRIFVLDAPPLRGPQGAPGNAEDRFYGLNRYLGPNRLGAVVEISPGKAAGKPVEVKLARCSSAEVRFLDAKGKPVRQRFWLELLVTPGPSLRKSREEGKPAAEAQLLAALPADLPGDDAPFAADAEGRVRIPFLIPGATYRIMAVSARREVIFEKDFTVESGKTAKLELTLPEAK